MKITNPTDKAISMQYLGTVYSIDANDSLPNVSDAVGLHWKEKVHHFVVLETDAVEVKEEVEEVEEVKEEKVEKVEKKASKVAKK